MPSEPHKVDFRVYYEDTDAGGVVYHANYLRFCERARTEMLRGLGLQQSTLRDQYGVIFIIRSVAVEYLRPARLDDLLTVETIVGNLTAATLDIRQMIRHEENILATAKVVLATLGPEGRVVRVPPIVRAVLAA